MKRYLFFSLALALAAVSCDKIEADSEGRYILFSGATGEGYDGKGVADHSQRVLLEKYTGVRCKNCPDGDAVIYAALESYGHKLVALAIHDSSSFTRPYGNDARLSTAEGEEWSNYFGISAYPTAMANRKYNDGYSLFNPAGGVNAEVDEALGEPTRVALAVTSDRNGAAYTIDVDIEFLQDVADPLTLTLLLMEDSVRATQLQPDGSTKDTNYIHNHLLRDVITNAWGADISADGKAGTKRHARFAYTVQNPLWKPEHCKVVAFISDKNTRQILNVAE